MSNIDDERIKEYLGTVEERINFAKENGCKLLDCKTIDANIKLRLENIKLRKTAEKLADIVALNTVPKEECKQCILDWARKEVENDEI